jgi:aspartyl-tRNA(Asn)/glutamyl-tRNA(Gln) amidotransferase subunit B
MFNTGHLPKDIVEEAGLRQIESGDEVSAAIDRAIASSPKAAEDYRAGKETAIQFLVGQVMRETKGRARPDVIIAALREKLNGKA